MRLSFTICVITSALLLPPVIAFNDTPNTASIRKQSTTKPENIPEKLTGSQGNDGPNTRDTNRAYSRRPRPYKDLKEFTMKIRSLLRTNREWMSRDSVRHLVPRPPDTSIQCYSDMMDYIDALIGVKGPGPDKERNSPAWAVRMLDATGRPPPGILAGAFQWVGQYDECLVTKATITEGVIIGGMRRGHNSSFGTRYCRLSVPFEFVWDPALIGETNVFWREYPTIAPLIKWGVCIPDSCHSGDLHALITQDAIQETGLHVEDTVCFESKPLSTDTWAVVTITCLSVLACAILVCTVLEVYDQVRPWWRESDLPSCLHGSKYKLGESNVVRAFSLYSNLSGLLNTTTKESRIGCVEGIRVIGMSWIVLGHGYMYGGMMNERNNGIGNSLEATALSETVPFYLVIAAHLGVDTFFVMSGFLETLVGLKKYEGNTRKPCFWVFYVVHRFLRLTPVYMVVLMTSTSLYDHVVTGPLRDDNLDEFAECRSTWWTHLLYINNFSTSDRECMTWTWFLAVCFQLYLVTPFLLVPALGNRRQTLAILGLFLCGGLLTTFASELHYGGQFLMMDISFRDYWQHVYSAPWSRAGGYTVGLILGVCMADMDRTKPPISKPKALAIWAAMSVLALTLVFLPHRQWRHGADLWSRQTQSVYEALSRPLWGVCIAWMLFACSTGLGGIVTSILSWKAFLPLGRLTYSVYLLHPVVIMYVAYSRRQPFYFHPGHLNIVYFFIGNMVLTHLLAIVTYVAVEMPADKLLTILQNKMIKCMTSPSKKTTKTSPNTPETHKQPS